MAPIRGTRSARDAVTWTCKKGHKNFPTENLLFDLPKFDCSCNCGEKFNEDFEFCIGDIKFNNHELLGEPMSQGKENHCVAFAYAKAMEITKRMKALVQNKDPGLVPRMCATDLVDKYEALNCKDKTSGVNRVVHMAQILKEQGIKSHDKSTLYKVSDVSTIRRDDYESIASNLAKGYPLHAGVLVGKTLKSLKFCQIYKPPLRSRFIEKGAKIRKHAVLLVGAGRKRGRWYFFFLNSWRFFCMRYDSKGRLLRYGVGKVQANLLSRNVVRLSRFKEQGGIRSLERQIGKKVTMKNQMLLKSID